MTDRTINRVRTGNPVREEFDKLLLSYVNAVRKSLGDGSTLQMRDAYNELIAFVGRINQPDEDECPDPHDDPRHDFPPMSHPYWDIPDNV